MWNVVCKSCYLLTKPAFYSWRNNLPFCCSPRKRHALKTSAPHYSCFVGAVWQPKATLQIKEKAGQEYLTIQVKWEKTNKIQLSWKFWLGIATSNGAPWSGIRLTTLKPIGQTKSQNRKTRICLLIVPEKGRSSSPSQISFFSSSCLTTSSTLLISLFSSLACLSLFL